MKTAMLSRSLPLTALLWLTMCALVTGQEADREPVPLFAYEPIAGSATFFAFDDDFDKDRQKMPPLAPYAGYRWNKDQITPLTNGERDFIRIEVASYLPAAEEGGGMKLQLRIALNQVMIDKLKVKAAGAPPATAVSTATAYTETFLRFDGAKLEDLTKPQPRVLTRHFPAAGVTVYSMPLVTFEGKTHALHLFVSRSMKRIADFVKLEGDKDYFKRHFPETQKEE